MNNNKYLYGFKQTLNTICALSSYLFKKNKLSFFPVVVMIEPTNSCNLKCRMCARNKLDREIGYMPVELFKKIITTHPQINKIVFCGGGEPLLHPDIAEMINFATQKNIRTTMNTNGLLLNEDKIKSIIHAGIHSIDFSFDGLNKEEYEKIRRGANYEQFFDNLTKFIQLRNKLNKKNICVSVDCVDFGYSFTQKNNLKNKFFRYRVDSINFIPLHTWPTEINNIETKAIFNKNKSGKYYGCFLPWIMILILWDGSVSGCCDDFNGKNIIGDLKKNISILDIWNSKEAVILRDNLLYRNRVNSSICNDCYRIRRNPWIYPIAISIKREFNEIFSYKTYAYKKNWNNQ